MSAKTGRPKVNKEDFREVFPIRISPREKALYRQAADSKGVGLSEWIRNALTLAAKDTLSNTESGADGIRARNSQV